MITNPLQTEQEALCNKPFKKFDLTQGFCNNNVQKIKNS